MPKVDPEANSAKRAIDGLASKLIDSFDKSELRRQAEAIIKAIRDTEAKPARIVVLGAAGSNKTSLSYELSRLMGLPAFDVDDYIPVGDSSAPDYPKRLREGWYNLWPDLPNSKGWIVEHVEAGHPDFIQLYKPRYAVLLTPGIDYLKSVAEARSLVSSHKTGELDRRTNRAMVTSIRSAMHFEELNGMVLAKGDGWKLKELR